MEQSFVIGFLNYLWKGLKFVEIGKQLKEIREEIFLNSCIHDRTHEESQVKMVCQIRGELVRAQRFKERFNSTFEFESTFKYSFESLKYKAYIETNGIMWLVEKVYK